jgi:hypothetical protein
MFDPPFPIGHLYKGEQDRIRAGDLNLYEREMLAKNEDPWAKFRTRKDEPFDGRFREIPPDQLEDMRLSFKEDTREPRELRGKVKSSPKSLPKRKSGTVRPSTRQAKPQSKTSWLSSTVQDPRLSGGGAGAMLITALGFEIGGAPKIAAIFFVAAWMFLSLTLYEKGWFIGRKRKRAILTLLAVAAGFFLSWWYLLPIPPSMPSAKEIAAEVAKQIHSSPLPQQPDFKLSLLGAELFTPKTPKGKLFPKTTGFIIDLEIRNAGAPSIATDWQMSVTPKGKTPIKADFQVLKKTNFTVPHDFTFVDAVSKTAIGTGELKGPGSLIFFVPLARPVILDPDTRIEVRVQDINGHTFAAEKRMGDWPTNDMFR